MSAGLQSSGVDGIVVPTPPLLELVPCEFVVFGGVPGQHRLVESDADTGAELAHDSFRVVQKVVGIDDADLVLAAVGAAICGSIGVTVGDLGSDDGFVLEPVEYAALLVVSSLLRQEIVPSSDIGKRLGRASNVAGNAVLRMTDQESKVELLEDLSRDDGRVTGLGDGCVWVDTALGRSVTDLLVEHWDRLRGW